MKEIVKSIFFGTIYSMFYLFRADGENIIFLTK